MTIEGLQKLTLLDYPGHTACTLFLGGCNFRCGYCHNYQLVRGPRVPLMEESEFLSYINKRKGLLDGVCITGGEPLIHREVRNLIEKIKREGLAVKLDTNGMFPDRLQELLDAGLLDYVAMDVKNSLDRYSETVRCKGLDFSPIEKSIRLLMESGIDYEFRTTVVKGLHTAAEIEEIAKMLSGAKRYFLQQYRPAEQVPDGALQQPSNQEMREYLRIAKEVLPVAELRGID